MKYSLHCGNHEDIQVMIDNLPWTIKRYIEDRMRDLDPGAKFGPYTKPSPPKRVSEDA
jgi:hypothetical protein